MSNSTLVQPQHYMFSSEAFSAAPEPTMRSFERPAKDGSGNVKVLEMKNVAVFRSGTFRDSMGDQSTWSREDLELFVQGFNHLRTSGTLPDVPVRKGHRSYLGHANMDGLIGYITGLRVHDKVASIEQQEYSFLVADYEILDSEAREKISSGLWRNRSAEVGSYLDNNDVIHGPAFLGFAYVDMPAVERLNEYANSQGAQLNFNLLTEEVMPEAPKPAVIPEAAMFTIGGTQTSDPAAVQAYINGLETANGEFSNQLTAMREAETQREFSSRAGVIDTLIGSNRMLAAQKDSTLALVGTMSAEQFSAWRAIQEAQPEHSLFERHGNAPQGDGLPENRPNQQTPEEKAFATATGVVNSLVIGGASDEVIKQTPSYAALVAKNPAFIIPSLAQAKAASLTK